MLIQNMDFKLNKWYQQVFILLVTHYSIKLEAATDGFLPEGRQCTCIGDRLIYNCSVVGGTATRWKGSLIECPLDVITLRHSQFENNQAFEICNDGDISGRGIAAVNNCFTSQLSVTVRESFNNTTVQCILNSNEGTRIIGESVLNVISATNPPPDDLHLADAQPGKLTFNWSSVVSNNCNIPQYYITSDCGTCPTATNMTTATCSDLQLTINPAVCHFRVGSQACSLTGNLSSPVIVTLKVPNVPHVKLVPSYSNNSQVLQKIFIVLTMNQTDDLFYISDGITGSPAAYRAHASNLVNGTPFEATVGLSSCKEGSGCPIELPATYCSQSTTLNITISTANKLGEGPHSNPFMIECTNNFIQVVRKDTLSESSISCAFQNPSDTSEKRCCITYQLCDQRGTPIVAECSDNFPYRIKLQASGHSSQFERYCYTVTANNGTYTAKVEGNFTLLGQHSHVNTATVAVAVTVTVFSVTAVLLFGTGIIVWIVIRMRNKNNGKHSTTFYPYTVTDTDPIKQYLVPCYAPGPNSTLKKHNVPEKFNRTLHDFITCVLSLEFKRGHTYYEFTSEVENILEGKDILLQDTKKPDKWFQLDQDKVLSAGGVGLYGNGIARNNFGDQYRVFIQSFGSGSRHLPGGSHILYNHSDDQVEPDVLPLVPVYSEHFVHKVINSEEECTVEDFCKQNRLNTTAFNIFLTVDHFPELERMRHQPPHDVILMKQDSKLLFTGPKARQILDPNNGVERVKWKVFMLLDKSKQGLVLKKGSEVLYQDSVYKTGSYRVLDVDQDCVRLSKFIETRLNCQYEDGKAFYEVTEDDLEEDLLYCKKILRPEVDKLRCEELKLESLIEYFYAIPGTPSKAVKSDKLKEGLQNCKIFIQSSSQGSRCLKQGTKLLYLKEYVNATSTGDQLTPSQVHSTSV